MTLETMKELKRQESARVKREGMTFQPELCLLCRKIIGVDCPYDTVKDADLHLTFLREQATCHHFVALYKINKTAVASISSEIK